AIALAAWAVLRLARAIHASGRERIAFALGGIALLVFAALAFFVWPKLAVVLAALSAAVAVAIYPSRRDRRPRIRGAVAAVTAALLLAVATPLVLAGRPHRQPDAFYDPPAGAAPGKP